MTTLRQTLISFGATLTAPAAMKVDAVEKELKELKSKVAEYETAEKAAAELKHNLG